MRRATLVSVGMHALGLGALVGIAATAPRTVPASAPPPLMVALTPLPAPAVKPQPVAEPQAPTPKPVATPRPPQLKPITAKPIAAKPVPRSAAPTAPVAATASAATEPAAAPAALPSPAPAAAPPFPAAAAPAGPDAGWLGQVRAALEAVKRYPQAALRHGDEGTATIHFTVGRDGAISAARLTGSSGSLHLDREAEQLLSRVGRLPPMPAGMDQDSIELTLPVTFALRR